MNNTQRPDRNRRLTAAGLIIASLILFISLTLQPAPEVAQVEPTRPRAVAGESGESDGLFLPLIMREGRIAGSGSDDPTQDPAPLPIQSPREPAPNTGPIYWGIYRPD